MVLERFAKPSVDESRLQGSSPCSSANTDEEQELIDEIVEMTSDLYDLDYAKGRAHSSAVRAGDS